MMMDAQTRQALVAWLEWQIAMGADTAVDAEATDWLARGPTVPGQDLHFTADSPPGATHPQPAAPPKRATTLRPPSPTAQPPRITAPAAAPARQFPTAAPDAAIQSARQLATTASSLDELQKLLSAFDGCALKATAKNLCFHRGAGAARLMLIGEAPGREEDLEGRPFVGRAGQLLDKMLTAAGFAEADCHITNVVYWRPPGNRTPTLPEVQVCRPFLERQIELVAPDVILLLGGVASKALLDAAEGIMRVRGKWHAATFSGRTVRVLATLHPAFLLRTPAAKRLAWRDFLAVRGALAEG